MTDDMRLYAKLTLDFADHPKIAPLSDRAFREYIEALLWSTRIMTDGFIPERMVRKLFTEDSLEELLTNDPYSPSLVAAEGGYKIHDFELHQNTKAKIEKKREAGRLGGLARAKNRANVADANEVLKQKASNGQAIQIVDTDIDSSLPAEPVDEPKSKGTRIPEPFLITDSMKAWANKKTPGLDIEWFTESFVDYWKGVPGVRGRKSDWLATWQNWMRRVYKDQPAVKYQKPSVPQPPRQEDFQKQYCEHHAWYPLPCSKCAEEMENQMLQDIANV